MMYCLFLILVLIINLLFINASDANGWSRTTPSSGNPQAGSGSVSVFLPNVGLFVLGGENNGVPISSFSMFADNTWTKLKSSPDSRLFSTAVQVNITGIPYMYVFGGMTSQSNVTNSMIRIRLSPTLSNNTIGDNDWENVTVTSSATPAARMGHSAVLIYSNSTPVMLVIGGSQATYSSQIEDIWTFNFETSEWKQVDIFPKPPAGSGRSMYVIDNSTVLLFGGIGPLNNLTNDMYVLYCSSFLDCSTHEMITLKDNTTNNFPSPRAFASSSILNGYFLLYGGTNFTNVFGDMFILDPIMLLWQKISFSISPPNLYGASTGVSRTQKMFLFGGNSQYNATQPPTTPSELWEFYLVKPCALYSSCGACSTMANSCGWCMTKSECVAGNSSGSSSCLRGYFYDTCPSCSYKRTCSSCSTSSNCTWCEDSQQCTNGDSQGPYIGQCQFYTSSGQNCSTCTNHKSCSSCLNENKCGWCFEKQSCVLGDSTGSLNKSVCPNLNTWWINKSCPNCSTATTCQQCTSNSNCGYCLSTNACLEGNSSSAFATGQCDRGYFYGQQCPSCPTTQACKTCLATESQNSYCGWCKSSANCSLGDDDGPFSGSCATDNWAVNSSLTCPLCSSYYDCKSCITQVECGWCNQFGGYCVSSQNNNLCPSNLFATSIDKCSTDPPNWDPSGWNSQENFDKFTIVMGVISGISVIGIIAAVAWWKNQSKKRLLPDAVLYKNVDEKIGQSENISEQYLYHDPQ